MVGTANNPAARYGRNGDTMIAHVTRGETIVPKPVLDANPHLAAMIARAISAAGANPEQYKVGHDMSINPNTGNPEFGFFSHGIGKVLKAVAPIAVSFIPGIGPVAGAAIGAGIGALGGGGLPGAALGGITGGVGGYINEAGGLAGAANNLGFGSAAYDALDSANPIISGIANVGSGAAGLFGGDTLGTASKIASAASLLTPQKQTQAIANQQIQAPTTEAPFVPLRPGALARPQGLSEMANYSPEQERSALATKGVNGGLGQDENAYYRNLVQRSLIGDGNKVDTSNPNFLLPVESQYFSKQGINTSDPLKFLQGLA